MSEYEPDDSRDVTGSSHQAPGEPPRTGYREDGARLRSQAEQSEVPRREQGQQESAQAGGERDIEGDAPEHPDRMGAFAGETATGEQQEQSQQGQPAQGDRWREAARREDNTPEGK